MGVLLFKQKTAYEMRISDWSSDVCSSDLLAEGGGEGDHLAAIGLLQPFQDHRGVEAAGIGENHLLDAAVFAAAHGAHSCLRTEHKEKHGKKRPEYRRGRLS